MTVSHAIVLASRLELESRGRLSTKSVGLIRQTLEGLAAAGVREVAVVDGRHAVMLAKQLQLQELLSMRVEVLPNTGWKNLSGAATLLAKKWLQAGGSCLVVRGERPLDEQSLRVLMQVPVGEDSDIAAAVLVSTDEGHLGEGRVQFGPQSGGTDLMPVAAIDPDLETHDGIYTGHAVVTASIIPVLMSLPNPTIEQAIALLAQERNVVALQTDEWSWAARRPVEVEDKVSALLDAKRHARFMLLNPGPVNTTARVKSALVHHDVCHRDSAFSELMVSLTGKLRRIFRATAHHSILPITGSGTAAMEASLVSTVPPDKKILILDNGAFGERLVEVAKVHGMNIVHLKYSWGEQISTAEVEVALIANPDVAVVAMIHHETSVGLMNPVAAVGALCQRHDVLLVVDAVSSLGAEDLDVVRDNIDICYSSANKCLHAISGASFVCVSPRVWNHVETFQPRSYYLDLKRYRKYVEDMAQTPFTPAVSVYFALDAACSEFLEDGHAKRFAMYQERNNRMREGLAALGMTSLTQTGVESNSIVTCRIPEGVEFPALYEAVKERGIIIYACKGIFAGKYMQIANMGELSDESIDAFLSIIAEEIRYLRSSSPSKSIYGDANTRPRVTELIARA